MNGSRREFMRKRDWSMLPDDISHQILEKWLFSIHHCRFAAACKNWFRIAMDVHCPFPFQHNTLFVLIPHNDIKSGKISLYQVSDSKTFEFNVPELRSKFIHSSSKGWLAVVNDEFKLSLINLFTRTHIKLPELSYALDVPKNNLDVMKKFAISENPSSSSSRDCVVAAIMSVYDKIFFCRLGDDSWTAIQYPGRLTYWGDPYESQLDLIFFGGKLYAAGENIIQVDFDGTKFQDRLMMGPYIRDRDMHVLHIYLVACSGNLLYVVKFGDMTRNGTHHKTRDFEVYKLEEDGKTWSKIYELGQHSLFLGGNESIAVSVGEISWCRPNCIYYVDDVWKGEGFLGDNGVFSFEDGSIETLSISHSVACRMSPSMWYHLKR